MKFVDGAIPVFLPNRAHAFRQALPAGVDSLILQTRSVSASLAEWLPAQSDALIAIVSHWPDFLTLARTVFTAAGFAPEALIYRDARQPNWQRGLRHTAAIVCDSLTARLLPRQCRVIPFPLLSQPSIDQLRSYVEFIGDPLTS